MSTHSSALSTPASAAVPALFVSHGAPLFALEAGETGPALTRWGQELKAQFPGLRGVVVILCAGRGRRRFAGKLSEPRSDVQHAGHGCLFAAPGALTANCWLLHQAPAWRVLAPNFSTRPR